MEVMPHNPAAGPHRAAIQLKVGGGGWPLSVELTVEPHVYLHAAELVQSFDVHGRMLGLAYKDECSAVWRQVEPRPETDLAEFAVSWLAIANASPRAEYQALLTVRDARGRLIEACPGFQNPTFTPGLIGSEQNPTDIGGLLVQVLSTDVAAASVVPFLKEPSMSNTQKENAKATPLKHVEVPPSTPLSKKKKLSAVVEVVRVAIDRKPASTLVIIDHVRIPQHVTWVDLHPGHHTLEVAIAGQPGDVGAAELRCEAGLIAEARVQIPPGETEAYSGEVPFNV